MTSQIRPALVLPAHALLALSLILPACGTRTAMRPPAQRDAASDTMPPDGNALDLRRDLGPDLAPDTPDLGPQVRPDAAPELQPDLRRDLPGERLPDVVIPVDRGPDRLGDLPPDRGPDLPSDRVLPVDRLPDLVIPVDRGPDLVIPVDRGPDLVIPVDRGPDRFGDLAVKPDLPRLDGPCADGATLACTCPNGAAGTRICLPSHVYSDCGCGTPELMRVRNGIIGTWTGTATTPWATYPVAFAFDSYTHYSATSLDGEHVALYYGTDEDSPDKRYDITDIEDNGDASGYLDLVWSTGGDSPTRELLSGIQLSADGSRLSFWFLHLGSFGPLEYDLQRATP